MKINDHIFLQIQKLYFWPISPIFGGKKSLSKKCSYFTHNLLRVTSTMAKFRKIWWLNSKKIPRQVVRQKDGQILFHKTLLATISGPTSTTPIDCHLKVKDIEYNVGPTKNDCITACRKSAQFITSFLRYSRF